MGQSAPFTSSKKQCLEYRFSTEHLPPKQQFEAWRALNSPIVDFLPSTRNNALGFNATITAYHLGNMIVSREKFDGLRFESRASTIRRGGLDHWILGLYKAGSSETITDDQVSRCTPGTLSLRSLSQPFRGESTHLEMLFVYIPREAFPHHALQLDSLNGMCLDGPLARLLSDFLFLLLKELPTLSVEDTSKIAQALQTMILSCLPNLSQEVRPAENVVSATMLQRAKRFISSHIQAPSLSSETLARELGISRATLYRLFEPVGGVAREIKKQRLLESHKELIDPLSKRKISEIAESFGFKSHTDYARSFKSHFGVSPSHARHGDGSPAILVHAPSADFRDWMKSLGK